MITLYLAARNLSIAEKQKLDLFAPCPMCHFSLSECAHILSNNDEMKEN